MNTTAELTEKEYEEFEALADRRDALKACLRRLLVMEAEVHRDQRQLWLHLAQTYDLDMAAGVYICDTQTKSLRLGLIRAGSRMATLDRLAKVWAANPDMRLGQLLFNATRDDDPRGTTIGSSIFFIEDEDLLRRLEELLRLLKSKHVQA